MDDWIRGAINYQVNLRSLAAREPRNAIEAANEQELASSPLAYLARNISILAELGITVPHIMPPFPMGKSVRKGIGSPYSVRNYRGSNSRAICSPVGGSGGAGGTSFTRI